MPIKIPAFKYLRCRKLSALLNSLKSAYNEKKSISTLHRLERITMNVSRSGQQGRPEHLLGHLRNVPPVLRDSKDVAQVPGIGQFCLNLPAMPHLMNCSLLYLNYNYFRNISLPLHFEQCGDRTRDILLQ